MKAEKGKIPPRADSLLSEFQTKDVHDEQDDENLVGGMLKMISNDY